ncbi:hypothetical protein IV203_022543 [Nitzschia inconspicua]|uniref:DUF6824 domain-containing protein n=1 Tax=Nitzschia inconspicua TaxID=303405 RepID=A0A9K3KJS1_9STRA|nr:hypothetical protein IV203_022543 [Nitzschia inconspicua]
MGDRQTPSSTGVGSPMTFNPAQVDSGHDVVRASREEWELLLARDREGMSSYERIEMEQDVEGRNRLAGISPSVTTKMGMKNLRRELLRMRQEYETAHSQLNKEYPQPQTGNRNLAEVAPDGMQIEQSVEQCHSSTRIYNILTTESVIKDDEILLRFLLADRLNAKKAARRLVEYHSMTVELFGDSVLSRPIMLGDLNRQERKLLESGWIQLLLTRDATGRRIMTVDEAGAADPSNIQHKLKVFMYVFQVAAMDSDTQKMGLHLILHRLFNADSPTGTVDEDAWVVDANERQMFRRFFACAPVRCSTIHINTPSPDKWVRILPSVIQMLGTDERGRIRFHEGSITACHQEMEAYGVPAEWMPMTSTGRRKLNEHKLWLKMQKGREMAMQKGQNVEIVECPRLNDILLTKTRRASSHPGNQKLRQVLEDRYEERYVAHPMKKQSITSQVADQLEEKLQARFLVKNKESFWVPADRNIVLDKLGNSFRFVPRLKPKSDSTPSSPVKETMVFQASEADLKPAAKPSSGDKSYSSAEASSSQQDSSDSRAMSPGPGPTNSERPPF